MVYEVVRGQSLVLPYLLANRAELSEELPPYRKGSKPRANASQRAPRNQLRRSLDRTSQRALGAWQGISPLWTFWLILIRARRGELMAQNLFPSVEALEHPLLGANNPTSIRDFKHIVP